jgi:hypothetical protein
MSTRLSWLPTNAYNLRKLSAHRLLLWVAANLKGQPLTLRGHYAELPGSVSVAEALADYSAGPGAGRDGVPVSWQMWYYGRPYASGM